MQIQSIQATFPDLSPVTALKEDVWTGKNWDGTNWVLNEDWTCYVKAKDYEYRLTIKKTFITDGGSIPEIVQGIFKPLGKYLLAYLQHDGLYASERITRILADNLLFDMLQYQGMLWIPREQVYSAVRIGGGFVWSGHTKEGVKNAGLLVELEWVRKPKNTMSFKVPEDTMKRYYPNCEVFNK